MRGGMWPRAISVKKSRWIEEVSENAIHRSMVTVSG